MYGINTVKKNIICKTTKSREQITTSADPAMENYKFNAVYISYNECRDVVILVLINIIAVVACEMALIMITDVRLHRRADVAYYYYYLDCRV